MKGPFGNQAPATPTASKAGGASNQTAADFVLRFSDVVNSSLHPRTGAVQYGVTGVDGENVDNADVYSSQGIVGRPLPPRSSRAGEQHMDMICVVTADGLVPFAYRDLRLKMGGNAAPGEGVLAFVGYGGGFHSMTPVVDPSPTNPADPDPSAGGTIHVIYCPYAFDSQGVAQKAHSIILDPTVGNESIIIAHAEGMAITFFDAGKKELVLKNASGNATLRLDDDGITMTGKRIVVSGGLVIGDPALAIPFTGGPAMPPCPLFFYSP